MRRRSFFQSIATGIGAVFCMPTPATGRTRRPRDDPDKDRLELVHPVRDGLMMVGFDLLPGQLATLELRALRGNAVMLVNPLDGYLLARADERSSSASLLLSQHLPPPGLVMIEQIIEPGGSVMLVGAIPLGSLGAFGGGFDPGLASVEHGPTFRFRAAAENRQATEVMIVVQAQLIEKLDTAMCPSPMRSENVRATQLDAAPSD